MKLRCDRCGEQFAIADNPALHGRAIKARCRACHHIVTAVPGPDEPATAPPIAPQPVALQRAAPYAPGFEGSALIEIRQLAARTLAAHPGAREPSARVAIQALLGSSRLATVIPMPEPARPSLPGWVVLLLVAALAIVLGTATFGLLLVRYAEAARSAARAAVPVFVAAEALPAAAMPAAAPATNPATPTAAAATAPTASSAPAPLVPAPPPAPVAFAGSSAGPPSAPAAEAAAPTSVAVRQRHRDGTSRSHRHHGHAASAGSSHATRAVIAGSRAHHRPRALDDDDLLRILDSTRAAGESSRSHGR